MIDRRTSSPIRGDAAVFTLLYCAMALGFFLLNGSNAYHPTDDGFILAYSWRVTQLEIPYRDFIYVRTPLSLYLHAPLVLLPEGWTIHAGRLAFYAELALAGLFPTLWAIVRGGLRASPRSLTVAVLMYLFAVHNFPPMPWPTVDGTLFGAAGITAFLFSLEGGTRSRLTWRAAAALLLTLAALAKQAFAPLPLLLVAYAVVEAIRGRHWNRLAASVVPTVLLVAVTLGALDAAGALGAFTQQIVAPAQLRPTATAPWTGDFLSVAVAPYFVSLLRSPIAILLTILVFSVTWSLRSDGAASSLSRLAGPFVVFGALVAFGVEMLSFRYDPGRHIFWLLVAALAATALGVARGRRVPADLLPGAGLLAVAWCSSLSFAYQTPALGLVAVGPLFAAMLPPLERPSERLLGALATAVILVCVLLLNLERPYRDVPRSEQVADLGAIFPRFGHLYTNAENYDRMRELRELSSRYALSEGRAFVVMPDYPLTYFLSGTRNPLPIDWFEQQEYSGNEEWLRREVNSRRPVVILEREPSLTVGVSQEPAAPCDRPTGAQLTIIADVLSRWSLVAEGYHFCVYRATGG